MSAVIRKAELKDCGACVEIYNYYIENTTVTFEETPLTVEEFEARFLRITEKYPFFVAEEHGKTVGYAYLDTFNPRSAYRKTTDLSIYLDKNTVSRGLGSLLLDKIEKEAAARGFENIISLVTEENATSVLFHKKHGFTHSGRLEKVGVKFGKELDVLFLQKLLKGTL